MNNEMKIDTEEHEKTRGLSAGLSVDRREIMKLGAGAVMATLAGPSSVQASVQAPTQAQTGESARPTPPAPGSMRGPDDIRPHTGPGYKNNYNRLGGNGPMDDTSRKIVEFVHSYDASKMTPAVVKAINRTMIDSMASVVAGFEEEPVRIAARMARYYPAGELKCTILGYGLSTSPELAAFANGCLIREVDFNDNGRSGDHDSILIPAALAVGEALHSTGPQVMAAVTVGYELMPAGAGGAPVASAMVAGKLMGLDGDRLANALTIALTPHVALNKGVGAMSMWKGVRSAESTKIGVWAAMLAREGLTGPPQPYEGKGAFWSLSSNGGAGGGGNAGGGRDPLAPWKLPLNPEQMAIEQNWFKRRPSEASSQGILQITPQIREWVKPDEIASMQYDTSFGIWDEICDAPKWDPQNRETADHSLPYIIARALIDGDIYLDSFTEAKYRDPAAHALMDKMTFGPVPNWQGLGVGRLTITKKSGETRFFDTYDGNRVLTLKELPHLTDDELKAKFDRVCAFKKISDKQRDEAYKVWGNLSAVKDIGDAMKTLAKFGQPRPL
jgi:2-methylcitrate dehydratase